MINKFKALDKIIKDNNLKRESVCLVGNHLMAKCLNRNAWIICHIENEDLKECKEYIFEDAIIEIENLLKDLRW